eukprot:scaffold6677_cov86-Isochrysis_galbana.AAC.4
MPPPETDHDAGAASAPPCGLVALSSVTDLGTSVTDLGTPAVGRRDVRVSPRSPGRPLQRVLKLAPLDAAQEGALLKLWLRVAELPPALLPAVRARSGGNPFFAQELVFSLLHSGQLSLVEEPIELPPTAAVRRSACRSSAPRPDGHCGLSPPHLSPPPDASTTSHPSGHRTGAPGAASPANARRCEGLPRGTPPRPRPPESSLGCAPTVHRVAVLNVRRRHDAGRATAPADPNSTPPLRLAPSSTHGEGDGESGGAAGAAAGAAAGLGAGAANPPRVPASPLRHRTSAHSGRGSEGRRASCGGYSGGGSSAGYAGGGGGYTGVGSDANLLVLDLPDSVHAMVMARVDALSANALLTLKVASVIGHSFSLATLAAIHPLSAGVVAAASSGSRTPGSDRSDRRAARHTDRYQTLLCRMQHTCNQLVSHALLRPCALYTEGGVDGVTERRGSAGGSCSRRSSVSSEASSASAVGGAATRRRRRGSGTSVEAGEEASAAGSRSRLSSGADGGEEHDYVFVSQLVREGVYTMLPFAQRARLHGAVAATLEREMAARDASEPAARRRLGLATYEGTAALAKLGSHWRAARKLGRAQAYTQRAAQCAASLHEVAWARSLLESALAISEERDEAASRADRNSAAADRNSAAADRNSADQNSAATDRNSGAADRNGAASALGSDRDSGARACGASGGAGGSIPLVCEGGGIVLPLGMGIGSSGGVALTLGSGSGGSAATEARPSERLLGPSDLEREIATLRRLEAWGGRANTAGEGAELLPPQPWRATSSPLLVDAGPDRHA